MSSEIFNLSAYALSPYAIPTFVTASAMLLLGIAVLVRERGAVVSLSFFLMTLSIGLWLFAFSAMYSTENRQVALWWAKAAYLGVPFIPSTVYYFSLAVLRIEKRRNPLKWICFLFSLIFSITVFKTDLLVSGLYRYGWGYYPRYGWLSVPFLGFFFGVLILTLSKFIAEYQRAEPGIHRMRVRTFLIGFGIAYLGSIDYPAKFGVPLYPFGYLPVFTFLMIAAWAIERYRLIDLTPSFAANEIVATMADPLIVCDAEGRIRLINDATRWVLGYSGDELLGRPIESLGGPSEGKSCLTVALEQGWTRDEEMVFLRKDGEQVEVSVSVSHLRDKNDLKIGAVVIGHDIRELKRSTEALNYLSNHDPLTSLPNRTRFSHLLSDALTHASRGKRVLAVLIVDLDRFKIVNETLGHVFGNHLLRAVSDRLSLHLGEGDALARLGGVRFALALTGLGNADDASRAGQRVLNALVKPFDLESREIFVNASIGISLYPDDGVDSEGLLRHAEGAMRHAKDLGGGNAQVFRAEMNVTALKKLTLETDLHHALEKGEFVLFYQPQVDLDTGQIIGMEALIRWNKPGEGVVNPSDFIPLAEQTGLITLIGEWGLKVACAQNAAWQKEGLLPVRMAVNLSARQFRDENLTKIIARVLEETDLGPNYLELELTEGLLMHGDKTIISRLAELNGMGVRFCIDDFGTGYSSLGYLKRFPINTLKIDQSFVQNCSTDPDSAAIATAIIQMAHCLKLKVIAEAVETVSQLEFLRSLRCDEIQGFLFSRPLPAEEITQLLKEGRTLQDVLLRESGDVSSRRR